VREMKVGPSEPLYGGRFPNHRVLRWLKTVVVSDTGKGALDASGGDQEDGAQSRL